MSPIVNKETLLLSLGLITLFQMLKTIIVFSSLRRSESINQTRELGLVKLRKNRLAVVLKGAR